MIAAALVLCGLAAVALSLLFTKPAPLALERLASPGALSAGPGYLGERCQACHEAGVGVTVERCTACHATSERLLGRQPTAFHASVEECAACHLEHQGQSVRPLVMDHLEFARVGVRTLERASGEDSDSAATLQALKTWLRFRRPGQLADGSALAALDCARCHDSRDPHFKKLGSDCAQCHGFNSWTVPGYRHPSPLNRECVQCHQAPPSHSMGHFSMISQTFARKPHASVNQCFECHNTTGWNDIVDVGFYKHH